MSDKTIHLASAGMKARAHTDNTLLDSVSFISTCPSCKTVRGQRNYGFRTLVEFLVTNQSIEAYCAVCNGFWPINAKERSELAWLLLTD